MIAPSLKVMARSVNPGLSHIIARLPKIEKDKAVQFLSISLQSTHYNASFNRLARQLDAELKRSGRH